jgi:hypothetical protein
MGIRRCGICIKGLVRLSKSESHIEIAGSKMPRLYLFSFSSWSLSDLEPTWNASVLLFFQAGFLMPSSSVLSRLKDGKAIRVVDEDAPEESRSQDTIESLYIRALLGGSAEERHAGQFE